MTPVDAWAFEPSGAAHAARSAARAAGSRLRPRSASRRGRRRRRARALPPRHPEGRPRARPRDRVSAARRRAPHRSDDAEASRDPRRVRTAAAQGRCSTSSIARSPRWAAACSASWLLRPLLSLDADPRSPRRGRGAGVPHDRARQIPRRAQGGPGPRAPGGARGARHGRPARSRRPEAVARPSFPACATCSPTCRRRSSHRSSRSSTISPTSATASRRTLIDDPPALARDGGFIRDGVDAELDELRRISRSGKQVIAEMEERERAAHGHRVAEGPLQPRVRLLHRGLEIEPARGAGRLPPQADHCRRRALHHAGAEGVRGEGPRRRRADPRARARALRGAARGGRRRGAAHPGVGARAGHARRAGRAGREPRPSTTTSSRTCTTATR